MVEPASKACPACGLVSPSSALRCDCGFDFATGLSPSVPTVDDLKGIGGWLVFVAIGVYAGPFIWPAFFYGSFFYGVKNAAIEWRQLSPEGLVLATTLYTTVLLIIFAPLEVWAIRLVLLLRRKSRRFPKEYIAFLVTSCTLGVAAFAVASYEGTVTSEDTKHIVRTLAFTVAWCAYMLSSKRVRNTFVV